ncbi:alpha/beta fold hydrolase [Clostridioides difficile]|uniref:alpha/beta fold hydrolase n=1 Tax=Clostridioides difficile TaxID=1496 RepID=UPI000BB19BFA|nr:alpha/beta hydrolase [Clostridioides difficile]PBH49961.1 hydrolase [Clostridioides difficile]
MFYNAKSCQMMIGSNTVNYIEFGSGKKTLIILPGLGDGLFPLHGKIQSIAFAFRYKQFAKDYKVYVFSRKNQITEKYSTRDMAKDQADIMKKLGIMKAEVMGVSQGGMIAQYLAIDYPELVEKLVLAVTSSKQNDTIQNVICSWIDMAKKQNYNDLMIDTAKKSYSERYLKKYQLFIPFLGKVGKPKDFKRFIIQATSCIEHNAFSELNKITCPTLIIGGANDKIVGNNASFHLAEKIKKSEIFIYEGLGHATYEEAQDFNERVLEFLNK